MSFVKTVLVRSLMIGIWVVSCGPIANGWQANRKPVDHMPSVDAAQAAQPNLSFDPIIFPLGSIEFDPSYKYFATLSSKKIAGERYLNVFDLSNGEIVKQVPFKDVSGKIVAITSDLKTVATKDRDELQLWRLEEKSGTQIAKITFDVRRLADNAWFQFVSNDVLATFDGENIQGWNAADGKKKFKGR